MSQSLTVMHSLRFWPILALITVLAIWGNVTAYFSHQRCEVTGNKTLSQSMTKEENSLQLESHINAVFMPKSTGLLSDFWRPTIVRACMPGMPKEWAPCKRFPNADLAEEIIYPDFKILSPRLADPAHASLLTECFQRMPHANIRDKEYVHYLNQHGRNFIFKDTMYTGTPRAAWDDDACMMVKMVNIDVFARSSTNVGAVAPVKHVMFAASPDSYSFQHFMDRVAVMLMQTFHLRTSVSYKYITMAPRDQSVRNMWKHLGNASSDALLPPVQVGAKNLLMACDAPLWHPYNTLRTAELVLQAAGATGRGVPRQDRKIIATLPRNDGTEVNGGRRWLNYAACEPLVKDMLKQRGQNEEVRAFNPRDFASFEEAIRFWNENVRLAIGIHGGGLYNAIWSSPETVIIELRPRHNNRTYGGTLFWELSRMINLTYWTIPVPAKNERYDAEIDCKYASDIIEKALTEPFDQRGPAIDTWYQGPFAPGL